MTDDVTIEIMESVTDADAAAIARLLPQLSATASFDRERIEALVTHAATDLLVARVAGELVGMATLVSFPLPTGIRGHVDDVVVDEAARGQGIARKLLDTMTSLASSRGMRTLDLTSRPTRVAAIGLYESVGFRRRDSLLLRYEPHNA